MIRYGTSLRVRRPRFFCASSTGGAAVPEMALVTGGTVAQGPRPPHRQRSSLVMSRSSVPSDLGLSWPRRAPVLSEYLPLCGLSLTR